MSKLDVLFELYNLQLHEIMETSENYANFLRFAPPFYKLNFSDIMLIYAQRPDATQCADFVTWTQRLGLRIRSGAKGIPVIQKTQNGNKTKYLFDVADVLETEQRQIPKPWSTDNLSDDFKLDLAKKATNFESEIEKHCLITSQRFETTDFLLQDEVQKFIGDCVKYIVESRCGLSWGDPLFQSIPQIKTEVDAVLLNQLIFNTARGQINKLYDIIKIERRTHYENERPIAEPVRHNSRTSDGRETELTTGRTLRTAVDEIHGGTASQESNGDAAQQHILRDGAGERPTGNGNETRPHRTDEVARNNADRPNGAHTVGKRHPSTGRGNSKSTSHSDIPVQLSLFADAFEQESSFEYQNIHSEPFVFKASEKEMKVILQSGSNTRNSQLRIAAEYKKIKGISEIADFLQKEFQGGKGFIIDSIHLSVWYAEDGIHLCQGNSARYETIAQIMPWTEVAERIGTLLEQGEFMTADELSKVDTYERTQLAEKLWYLLQHFSDEAIEQGYMSRINELYGGFPDSTAKIAEILKNQKERSIISEQLKTFAKAYEQDRSLLRFHYYHPSKIHSTLQELELPRREFKSLLSDILFSKQFITQDEIDASIINGFDNRIHHYFIKEKHSLDEKVKLLKECLGVSCGCSHALSRADGSFKSHSSKGIRYTKNDCEEVNLSWKNVAKRIDYLIANDRYVTQEEKVVNTSEQQAEPLVVENSNKTEHPIEAETTGEELIEQQNAVNPSPVVVLSKAENYHIPTDFAAPSGQKAKYQNNVAAIKLLKKIETENRTATNAEQAVLAGYVGFGGIPQAFDATNDKWAKEYTELRSLLTEQEYSSARASTLNAHYTPPVVINAMYQAIDRLGFKKGKILDAALGVGYFYGLLPESMENSKLYGVELDSLTGRLAKQLYPNANIRIEGFQDSNLPTDFDVAIGNVPFGNYNISDGKYNLYIHDFFFVKSLDLVKDGGIVAYITSKGTMDKANPSVRRMIAQKADLLGAIRLPNNTFQANAGTKVTTDILFLQKRNTPLLEEPDWLYLGYYNDTSDIKVNQYYLEHPEMMLGTMTTESTMYGKDTTLTPYPDKELSDLLQAAIQNIQGEFNPVRIMEQPLEPQDLPLDSSVKMFTYTVIDDNIYYNDSKQLTYVDASGRAGERIKAYVKLNEAVHNVIDVQLSDGFTEERLKEKQAILHEEYDAFVRKFGFINERTNQLALQEDIDIALLSSIEDKQEDAYVKGAIFDKATVRRKQIATHADSPMDALLMCLSEKAKIDVEYMTALCGMPAEQLIADLQGHIYINHIGYDEQNPVYITAEEYLSGDVKTKLEEVQELVKTYPELRVNESALKDVQPKWIPAADIGVRLSSNWIDVEYINDFIYQLLQTPKHYQGTNATNNIFARYDRDKSEWFIFNKTSHSSVAVTQGYGTKRINAYSIIEQTLNQREITIKDPYYEDGKTKYKYNHQETIAARQKQDKINYDFKDWIFKDSDRRALLEQKYNDTFNRIRPRKYDGSYLKLDGMSATEKLRTHQLNAVARIRTGNNSLLAHVVGAGKTYAMVAGGMEQLRLNIAGKLLYVVPNHMIDQFAGDFLKLYPTANILVTSQKDFEKQNRHRFVAKIATADVDAVILGHSQFGKIAISPERQRQEIQHELDCLDHAINSAEKENAPRYTVKKLEKAKMSLTEKMKKLLDAASKDKVLYFEQLGVDSMFIDEAHNFKNGAIHSKMSNVAGVSDSSSLKATDMLSKTRYLAEVGGCVTFATGTPISNSVCEMYVIQRYLQEQQLQWRDIYHFDEWASNFGETVSSIELKPEGSGYRSVTRFSQFYNLPELMAMFREVADIQTTEMLDLPKPELHGGKPIIVACEPSEELLKFMDECVFRAEQIRSGQVQSNEDNMLKLTNEARKAGTDMRLLYDGMPADPNGKIAQCAHKIYHHYIESNDFQGAQIVFSDIGTPNPKKFNIYDELKKQLIELGIPQEEIAFIHDAKTDLQKENLFEDMRNGKRRVLLGSTAKCGAGTNIQKRLVALHHIDCPWRPSDIEQREGRILRQGNDNKEVFIYRYATKKSFDSYLWQLVEQKQKFISQIMTGNEVGRTCQDIDDAVLSFAEVKAIASGDPRIKERMELEMQLDKLKVLKQQHSRQLYDLQDKVNKEYPVRRLVCQKAIDEISKDCIELNSQPKDFSMEVGGRIYDERTKAGEAMLNMMPSSQHFTLGETVKLGMYRGLKIAAISATSGTNIRIAGSHKYYIYPSESAIGLVTKIENAVDNIENQLLRKKEELQSIETDMEQAEQQLKIPFEFEQELSEKQARLIQLTTDINAASGLVDTSSAPAQADEEPPKQSLNQEPLSY